MKVLLVNAVAQSYKEYYAGDAYTTFPAGILSIAAVLEKNGHEVKVLDGCIDSREPKDYATFNPDIVGFSVITGPNLDGSITQAKELKEVMPEVKVIWGNVHPSVLPEQTLAESYIDYLTIGAGEYTLLELIQYLENGNPKLEEIKGLAFKRNGKVIINETRPFIKNLEELPNPAWHLVDVMKYSVIGLNTSRGCPNRCSFCYNKSYNKGYTGFISAEKIISQIEYMKIQYGAKYIRFQEDNFTFNRKRLREFCRLLIDKKLKITWSCDSRVDLKEEDVALMAKSGCIAIGLGLETGSQRMLDFIKKDVTVDQMERTFWYFVKNKIRTSVYIIYGYPTETAEDLRMTHEMLERLDNPYYMYNRYFPVPGSVLFDYCVTNGLITPPEKLDEWSGFIVRHSHEGNLSNIPQEVIDETAEKWRSTYSMQRVRFTMKHDPSYFWTILTNPLKFFRELRDLIKYQSHANKFHKIALKKYPNLPSSSTSGSAPIAPRAEQVHSK
jgi:radical SAM superfamily enzyme YgiQ (UPF0313 family)